MAKKEKKLPPIETKILSDFVFGDPEAKSDEVLTHCFQNIRGVNEFLIGNKSIVLGERGAGKSALFKQISNGTLCFQKDVKEKYRKTLIIPIDEDIEYLAIANIIEERFADQSYQRLGKYRYLWEIYILSRVIQKLIDEYSDDLEITTIQTEFSEILGIPKDIKFKFTDLFSLFKYSVGTKIDSNSGVITPSFSVEPVKNAQSEKLIVTDSQIAAFRDRVRKVLRSKSLIAIVLVDRVDDFVVGSVYEEQLKSIQALVDCIQSFRLPELKLKVFLRTDLFKRLNPSGGFDKISAQIARLEWSKNDICEFVARRLAHNYVRLGLRIHHDIDLSLLEVDPMLINQIKDIFKREIVDFKTLREALVELAVIKSKILWSKVRRKSHSARQTDLLHAIVQKIVMHIFPMKVTHINKNGIKEDIPLETYFETHFNFGSERPNPRLVLLFLIFTFEEAAHYYSQNPDKSYIEANELDEYELILKENIFNGYLKLQDTARQTVAQLNPDYRRYVERIFLNLKKPLDSNEMSLDKIKSLTSWDLSDEELHKFVKLFNHIGLFKVDNEMVQFENRKFSFPIIMKSGTCA